MLLHRERKKKNTPLIRKEGNTREKRKEERGERHLKREKKRVPEKRKKKRGFGELRKRVSSTHDKMCVQEEKADRFPSERKGAGVCR